MSKLSLTIAGLLAATTVAPLRAQMHEVVLHNFAAPPGLTSYSGVIRDSAGNLYGTTRSGGLYNDGVVFKVDSAGHTEVLHSFKGQADGAHPLAGVVGDGAGNLYGTTTSGGGSTRAGVVYKLDGTGHETILHRFTGDDGGAPHASVIRDAGGNLYGTTAGVGSGLARFGSVYKLDPAGHLTVLYRFTGGADGRAPISGLTGDGAGNFYGTTTGGGSAGAGVVYKLDNTGHLTVLYNFTGGADGSAPFAGLVRDSAGNLYGTTSAGGDASARAGVVYRLDVAGHLTVLHTFTGGADGGGPNSDLILDAAGSLYGTTTSGGTGNTSGGAGVVYQLDATGHYRVLYNFTGAADGGAPQGGALVLDSLGTLYGTTSLGGSVSGGVVFALDATLHQTVLANLGVTEDGFGPNDLIGDGAGNLYGTTAQGGPFGLGVVFKVDGSAGETVLHAFSGGADGDQPSGGVIRDSSGNLYGTTYDGGSANSGVVYKVDSTGQQTVLYEFQGGPHDGSHPVAGVLRDSSGNLFGTTYQGGRNDQGTVYVLDATGHETVLYQFTGRVDGAGPDDGLISDLAGGLVGVTLGGGAAGGGGGVIYRLDAPGHETVLHAFTAGTDGFNPYGKLTRDPSGNLYGTTDQGGPVGHGTVYRLDPAGHLTVLHAFTGGTDGGFPQSGVIRDADGNLCGTTSAGGTANAGVVYKVDINGSYSVLYSFTGGTDGFGPSAGVIRDAAGNLYGTTFSGGKNGGGVVFKLTP